MNSIYVRALRISIPHKMRKDLQPTYDFNRNIVFNRCIPKDTSSVRRY